MGKFLSGKLIKPVLFFVFLVLIFSIANEGYCFAKDNKAALDANTVKSLRLFSKVYTLIKNNYIKKESSEKLIFGAVEGMVSTLDPHTYFLTPSEFRQMKSETSGEFVGIGVKISTRNRYIVVISPIDGSPAAKAGIKAGDIIEKINNISTYNMNIMKAVGLLHGRAGTSVNLLIERKGFKKPEVFKLVRKNIILKSVKYMILPHHIGYVRISSFQYHTNSQLLKALRLISLKERGIKGLILDLRNNPGGLLNQAVKVCSDFIKSGVIVYTKGRIKSQDEKYFALGKRPPFKFPVVVLVNSGTASAAEITAGSLQAHKRAIVVGTRTFGKGSVQTIYTLPGGTGIGLTTAFYFLPNGVSVQDTGVIPNFVIHSSKDFIFVKPLPKLREVDLRHHFKNPESKKIKEKHNYKAFKVYYKKDDQFRFAYELLKSWNSIKSIGAN
ncbi:MAG: S41 family peptidase [Deltaproteobacteria bacterium]|jgi:carboxyl-terminal processing protease|nr:S41 family peptidase [Deltaproteobacteria bacterium]MCL5880813.1 S41 family peptidase [Deltaproteobacteria bacterium]MDA8304279.1 S41 family peptidase [Deltaproteobacteria bacterium]